MLIQSISLILSLILSTSASFALAYEVPTPTKQVPVKLPAITETVIQTQLVTTTEQQKEYVTQTTTETYTPKPIIQVVPTTITDVKYKYKTITETEYATLTQTETQYATITENVKMPVETKVLQPIKPIVKKKPIYGNYGKGGYGPRFNGDNDWNGPRYGEGKY